MANNRERKNEYYYSAQRFTSGNHDIIHLRQIVYYPIKGYTLDQAALSTLYYQIADENKLT